MTASGQPPVQSRRFASFREFYPYYLQEHGNRTSRRLHVTGTLLALGALLAALVTGHWGWLIVAPMVGYAFAWVGHAFFEHNSPATFRHPLYSLRGDFTMLRDVLAGRMRW